MNGRHQDLDRKTEDTFDAMRSTFEGFAGVGNESSRRVECSGGCVWWKRGDRDREVEIR